MLLKQEVNRMEGNIDSNAVAEIFERIALLLEIKGEDRFKINAYRRVAESLRNESRDIYALYREGKLKEIPGVGKAIEQKICELLESGKLEFYEKLTEEVPDKLLSLYEIPEMGPKRIKTVWEMLGIETPEGLERAAREGKLKDLPGFGPKVERKILEGIKAFKEKRLSSRFPLGEAWKYLQVILDHMKNCEGIIAISPAGSLRRMKETVGDLDILVAAEAEASEKITNTFTNLWIMDEVILSGPTKTSMRLKGGLQADLRIVEPARWGTALQYFTGSQQHNILLREAALKKNLSLSEYALRDTISGVEILCPKEEDVYGKLGMSWIPPELREGTVEIKLALEKKLPKLIETEDIKGDLQIHSNWSDGKRPLKEMVEKACELGRSYILITDHSQGLGVAKGLTPDRLTQQWHEIDELNEMLAGKIVILKGTEVEVKADGSLDYDYELLKCFDVVVAAVHSNLRQDRDQLTERYIRAISHPLVHILAHPTGRLFGSRDEAEADWEEIFKTAASTGTLLEINAHPSRLDLSEKRIKQASSYGCMFAISTDAHDTAEEEYMFFGVAQARRAWLTVEDVANAQSLDAFLGLIKKRSGVHHER